MRGKIRRKIRAGRRRATEKRARRRTRARKMARQKRQRKQKNRRIQGTRRPGRRNSRSSGNTKKNRVEFCGSAYGCERSKRGLSAAKYRERTLKCTLQKGGFGPSAALG